MAFDVLDCQLLNVDGRTYRVVGQPGVSHQAQNKSQQPVNFAEEEPEIESDKGFVFEVQQEDAQYVIRLAYDAEIFPHIIGQKGRTKLKVEQDTGAAITIPRKNSTAPPGSKDADVVVRAPTHAAAVSAATRLELLVNNVLESNKLEYTHFVSIPLNSAETQTAFERFKAAVLSEPGAAEAAVEESIFVATKQIHLTVMMLKLYSEQKRHLAKQTLHSLQPTLQAILEQQQLAIHVKGLEYMNDDPSATHVAYVGVKDPEGQPDSVQKLQQICAAVVDAFSDAGLLLTRDERDVKLHATVLNTRHRRRTHGNQGQSQDSSDAPQHSQRPRHFDRKAFDGRWLLAKYADLDLGVQQMPQIHLSQRGKYDDDGYYHALDRLAL